MDERAAELSNRTLRLVHQILERAIRHAQARDKVRRNVASLILVPEGQEGRPSKALTLDQAVRLLDQEDQAASTGWPPTWSCPCWPGPHRGGPGPHLGRR